MAPHEVTEVPLAVPKVPEFGPDLTFIKITKKDRLESIKGISSFWTIDDAHRKRAEDMVFPGAFTVSSGFPSAEYNTFKDGKNIQHNVTHRSFLGVMDPSRIFRSGEWDYFESQTDRVSSHKLPESFAGVSGGGV